MSITATVTLAVAVDAAPVAIEWDGDAPDEVRARVLAALPDEIRPETRFAAERQARRAREAVRNALNSDAYFAPFLTLRVGEELTPQVLVEPGPRFSIADLSINWLGEDRPDDPALLGGLALKSGDVAIPADVIAAETELVTTLQEDGRPFARAGERQVLGDREAATIDVIYSLDAGPRVTLGNIRYAGAPSLKRSYLSRLETTSPGVIYDPEAMERFESRLQDTRLFDRATVTLTPEPVGTTPEGMPVHDIVVQLDERDRYTVEAGVQYATNEGVGVTGELIRRNLTGRGDLLTTRANLLDRQQAIRVEWRRPHEFGFGSGLVTNARLINERNDAFDRQEAALGLARETVRSDHVAFTVGGEAAAIRETDPLGERDLGLVNLLADLRLDYADDPLNPTRGWRSEARTEPSVAFGGSDTQFIRTTGQLRGYLPVGEGARAVLAGRFRFGTISGAATDDVPLSRRFFAGGGGSVRGYDFQGIGPTLNGEPVGGRSLVELSVEARVKVRDKWSVVGFVDAGDIGRADIPELNDLRAGAGLGLRYDTIAGPLRVDIAAPLDRQQGDEPVHIYISLGQAF